MPIEVFVWKPFKVQEDQWACPYQIKGFGDEVVRYSYGSDAMQALQLSFDGLRANLNPKENRIYWGGPEIGDAGFAQTITIAYRADVYEYLCELVDREVMPFPDDPRRSVKTLRRRVAKWKQQNEAIASNKPRKRSRKD